MDEAHYQRKGAIAPHRPTEAQQKCAVSRLVTRRMRARVEVAIDRGDEGLLVQVSDLALLVGLAELLLDVADRSDVSGGEHA